MARKQNVKVNVSNSDKPVIKSLHEGHEEEYLARLKKGKYDAGIYDGIITVYVDEITDEVVGELRTFMKDYRKSYGILPKSRKKKDVS